MVVQILLTIESIHHAVKEAEADSGLDLNRVQFSIAGQHIRSLQHSDYILRENASGTEILIN